jgi:hypothetical protein
MTDQPALRSLFGTVITCLQTISFVATATMNGAEAVQSAELWDFVHVGKNFETKPRWDPRRGKADVQISGRKIMIRAYFGSDAERELKENSEPNVVITGTLAANGAVSAKCILVATDASPVNLTGRYITRTQEENWGGRRKLVTLKELVFPRLPNDEFWGFLGRDVVDR